VTGGTPADGLASFAVSAGTDSVSNDFNGGDGGANTALYVETGVTTATLGGELTGTKLKGIKKVTLVSNNPGQTTPSSLTVG
jgi:hypothetical protein